LERRLVVPQGLYGRNIISAIKLRELVGGLSVAKDILKKSSKEETPLGNT
jgi:hypothetical protein